MLLNPSLKWHPCHNSGPHRKFLLQMRRGAQQQQQVKLFLKGADQTLLTMLQLRWRPLNAP